jgi:predicted RNA binding protein YcfA (HicA-like mRNA interferase family)
MTICPFSGASTHGPSFSADTPTPPIRVLPKQTALRELIRRFVALGWSGPYSGGSHRFMRRGAHTVRIPNPHSGDVDISLLRRILKQANVSDEEWNGA